MSSQKKKRSGELPSTLSAIKELLVTLKPLLRVPLLPNVPPQNLITTLSSITDHANKLTVLCSKRAATRAVGPGGEASSSTKRHLELQDQDLLDGEGVNIWNRSGEYKTTDQQGLQDVYAAMRLAGFRLVEAGYDGTFDGTAATRLLVLGSKTGVALLAINQSLSYSILEDCVSYHDLVATLAPSRSEGEAQERARAITQFYIARTEFDFRRGELEVALFMFDKGMEDRRVGQLAPKDIYDLILVAQEIATHLLGSTSDATIGSPAEVELAKRGTGAVEWLTRALRLGEAAERAGGGNAYGGSKVKRDTMTSLALAFVLSATIKPENLESAEVMLDELLADPDIIKESSEASRSRWLKLECVRRRKAGDAKVIDALRGIVENDSLDEGTVNRILREIMHSKTGCTRPVASAVLQLLLNVLVRHRPDEDRLVAVTRTVLSISIHAKGSENMDRGCRDIRTALDTIERHPAYKPDSAACAAYQTVFWQMGDAAYTGAPPRFAEAAKCYDLGLHPCLDAKRSTFPKIYRKVALCYIQLQDYERATERIKACSWDESTTHYLRFLIYAQQGLEDEAVEALTAMTQSTGLDGRQLILATQLANDSGLGSVVVASLQAILHTIRDGKFVTQDVAVFVLLRCLIRLTLKRIEAASNGDQDLEREGLVDSLNHQYKTAVQVATKAVENEQTPAEKELAWLYKQAYNAAIDGATRGWLEPAVYGLFESSLAFMDLYADDAVAVDSQLPWQRCLGSFASLCSRTIEAKGMPEGDTKREHFTIIADRSARESLRWTRELLGAGPMGTSEHRRSQLQSMCQVARVYQVEALCSLRQWTAAEAAVQEATKSENETSTKLFETLCNIIWTQPDCPPEVTLSVCESLLRQGLSFDFFRSADSFSRWLRTVVVLLFQRGGASNIDKALGYCAQAAQLVKAHASTPSDQYPEEEVEWMFATSWNKANEDHSTSNFVRAKGWVEVALELQPFTNANDVQAQRLRTRYSELLDRIASVQRPASAAR